MYIQDRLLKQLFPQAQFVQSDYASWLEMHRDKKLEPHVDSRNVHVHSIFFALQGASVDGHQFIEQAIQKGALIIVIDQKKKTVIDFLPVDVLKDVLFLLVDDVEFALIEAARYWRSLFNIPVIGITGSMGKTTVKEILGYVFQKSGYEVLIPLASYNSNIGVSLTALRLEETHQIALFEMGINACGEMDELVDIVQPTAGILTTVAHAHTEGLIDLQTIVQEKEKIFSHMSFDDLKIVGQSVFPLLSDKYKDQVKIVGAPFLSDVWFQDGCFVCYGESLEFKHKEFHEGRLYNRLVAIACATLHGVSLQKAVTYAFDWMHVTGRFEKKQIKGTRSYVINDACNANPESVIESCTVFEKMQEGHAKVTVLGPMLELGAYANEGHRLVMETISSLKTIDVCIFVGDEFQRENVLLSEKIKYIFVKDAREAECFLMQFLKKNEATVLLKSSKSVGLAKIAQKLC